MNDQASQQDQNFYDDADAIQEEADVAHMQISIDQAQHQLRLSEALDRLQQHPDFKLLVMGDYLKEQTVRLGHLLSEPAYQHKSKRKPIINEMHAIGTFLSYLRSVDQRGRMAREAIRVNEAELRHIAQASQSEGNH